MKGFRVLISEMHLFLSHCFARYGDFTDRSLDGADPGAHSRTGVFSLARAGTSGHRKTASPADIAPVPKSPTTSSPGNNPSRSRSFCATSCVPQSFGPPLFAPLFEWQVADSRH